MVDTKEWNMGRSEWKYDRKTRGDRWGEVRGGRWNRLGGMLIENLPQC